MTKFEQIGVELQQDAGSLNQARKCFHYSCKVCCSRGMQIPCDRCAIRIMYESTAAYFATEGISAKGKMPA